MEGTRRKRGARIRGAWAGGADALIRRFPAAGAWPFVLVILTMLGAEQCSSYLMSATRAVVTAEGLWSRGQHEATVALLEYAETHDPEALAKFRRTIVVPLADMAFRDLTEDRPFSLEGSRHALSMAGNYPEDMPYIVFMFRRLRGFSYLEDALVQWKGTDGDIVAMARMADALERSGATGSADVRRTLNVINHRMIPRTVRFSVVLNQGARFVERTLSWVNDALAAAFAGLAVWRVGEYLRKQRRDEEALAWQASHDDMTGLHNRRAFEERLAAMEAASEGAVMFIDLDQFKIVNDTAGHAAGDALLRRVCAVVAARLRKGDMLARLGGDEFGIVMPDADAGLAAAAAEAVRAAVEGDEFVWDRRRFAVTTSIGVAALSRPSTVKEIMAKADVACFMAKERGRNRVEFHREGDLDMAGREAEMSWVARIRHALEEDRFVLHAQEIASLKGAAGTYAEVLVRMRDEQGRIVPPGSFLPAAERFGLMGAIDRKVVDRTLAALSRGGGEAVAVDRVAVNVSGQSVSDRTFLAYVEGRFEARGVDPRRVSFEITESMAVAHMDVAKAFIAGVRSMGCGLSLDDFGTGMSSLRYLKDLDADILKIDGAFVKNVLTEVSDQAMVEMVAKVGRLMGMKVVAEFVETADLAEALKDAGVDYVQGYAVAKPRPFDATFECVGFETGIARAIPRAA